MRRYLFCAPAVLAAWLVAAPALAEDLTLWLKCENAAPAAVGAPTIDAVWRIGPESMVLFAADPPEAGDEFCADRGGVTSWCTVGETEISYEASRGEERWDYVINRRTGRATLTHAKSGGGPSPREPARPSRTRNRLRPSRGAAACVGQAIEELPRLPGLPAWRCDSPVCGAPGLSMPLIPFARILTSWLGLLLLGAALYLLWTWWTGEWIVDPRGFEYRVHQNWRAWTALAVLIWSVVGRWPATWLLAKADTDPTAPKRADGSVLNSPTGSELYVETRGGAEGPVVIATHGWGLDSTIWQYLNRDLATHRGRIPHQELIWDLPGLGRSKPPADGEISLKRFARDLAHLIEHVAPRPVILIGHSIGGMTIQTLARDNPALFTERVVGVVLIDTTYTNPLHTMILSKLALALRKPLLEPVFKLSILLKPLAWLGAWQGYFNGTAHMANRLQFGEHVTRSQLEHTTLLGTRNSPAILSKGNLAMFDWDAAGAVAAMSCPVLILGGDMDIVTKLEASETMQKSSPLAGLEAVPDANHMGFLERSEIYNGAIMDFIAERSAAVAPAR